MKKLLLMIIALLLPPAEAGAVENLYTSEVVVANQGEDERNAAVPDALIQVLQKLSGQRELAFSPALDEALSNANRLLHSFRYKNLERTGSDGVMFRELRLVAQFRKSEIDRVVQQAGLPRWGQDRPPVQIWVVMDDGLNRQFKPVEFGYAWEAMENIAAMRGLSLIWPDLDEEELQLIDMGLVWGGFIDYLVERGAPHDGVAIVTIRRDGPFWALNWAVSNGAEKWSWRNSDQELMFALVDGIHQMTDRFAASNTIAASAQSEWSFDITIGGINSARDYAACLDYLGDLSLVTGVEVAGADPGRVHFVLQLNASPEHLPDVFSRGAMLYPSRVGSQYDYELLR